MKEPLEGLIKIDMSHIVQRFGKEARVEQVQDCVLDATNVLIHW